MVCLRLNAKHALICTYINDKETATSSLFFFGLSQSAL
jgi:hypothetical protein